jgi:hypothetical protein
MTNRSKPALGGMPLTETFMMSLSLFGVMVTCPLAWGRQVVTAADGSSANENDLAVAGALAALAVAPKPAVRPTAATTAPAAATALTFAAAGARMPRIEGRMLFMTCGLL